MLTGFDSCTTSLRGLLPASRRDLDIDAQYYTSDSSNYFYKPSSAQYTLRKLAAILTGLQQFTCHLKQTGIINVHDTAQGADMVHLYSTVLGRQCRLTTTIGCWRLQSSNTATWRLVNQSFTVAGLHLWNNLLPLHQRDSGLTVLEFHPVALDLPSWVPLVVALDLTSWSSTSCSGLTILSSTGCSGLTILEFHQLLWTYHLRVPPVALDLPSWSSTSCSGLTIFEFHRLLKMYMLLRTTAPSDCCLSYLLADIQSMSQVVVIWDM